MTSGSVIVLDMIDILVFVYQNYWRPDACPEPSLLAHKLTANGFESEEIQRALAWLDGLHSLDPSLAQDHGQRRSLRVYSPGESLTLGSEGIGFLMFLEDAGVLTALMREWIIERSMALRHGPIPLEDLKIIVLMVFWRLGHEPDALILDELFVDEAERLIH